VGRVSLGHRETVEWRGGWGKIYAWLAAMYLDEACVSSHLSTVENNNTDLANVHVRSLFVFSLLAPSAKISYGFHSHRCRQFPDI